MTITFEQLLDDHEFAYQPAIDLFASTLTRGLNRAPTVHVHEKDANLVSSRLVGSKLHSPVLDIDFDAHLNPSSTGGHYHLYLDCPMTWRAYKRLLRALARAGVIERGYYLASKARKATYVRKPGVLKKKREEVPAHMLERANAKRKYGRSR